MARSAWAAMPTVASSASAASRCCNRAGRQALKTPPACEIKASCTFSTTVSEAKVSAIWKVRPTPRRQIASGRLPTSSVPPSSTEPPSGFNWPLTILKQVVLPAPLGPIKASISPARRLKLTSSTARRPPKALARWDTRSSGEEAPAVADAGPSHAVRGGAGFVPDGRAAALMPARAQTRASDCRRCRAETPGSAPT